MRWMVKCRAIDGEVAHWETHRRRRRAVKAAAALASPLYDVELMDARTGDTTVLHAHVPPLTMLNRVRGVRS